MAGTPTFTVPSPHPTMSHAELQRLDAVAAALPFAIDDYDAANAAFVAWREGRGPRRAVDLWAYCYVQRYVLTRFARETGGAPSDLDVVLTKAYERVLKSYDTVRDPGHFAQFVSVVCKNTLLNNRSRRRAFDALDETTPDEDEGPADIDVGLLRHTLAAAISALPEGIRETARLRFLEGLGYPDLAERIGKEVPTARAYVSKAVKRLRQDPALRALHFDDVAPPGALDDDRPPP